MKVKEFAESQGITTQAVYQRLRNKAKKSSKQLSDYVSGDTSEITEEGYKVLQSLYKQPVKQKETKRTVDNDRVNTLTTENERLSLLVKSLETRIQDKEREISRLEESVAHERQVNRMLLESLPRERPGIFRRLFAGKQDKKATTDKP